tara:strand:+ start:454 stop:1227 length:774 start_codon:yes stop_codon:yes gene_type:complete
LDISEKNTNDFSLTLVRGIKVLEIFSPEKKVVTTREVAELVGISRAAARRLLLTFTALGYLEQTNSSFGLTGKIASIGQGLLARQDKWTQATAMVLELSNRMNESFAISILEGKRAKYVARDQKLRISSRLLRAGDSLPAHCSAPGKVLLAALTLDELNNLLETDQPFEQCTEQSITDIAELKECLRKVRLQSWGTAEDEFELGMIAIAVPVFDQQGRVVAAMSVGSTKQRRTVDELREEFLPVLQDAAEKLSSQMT